MNEKKDETTIDIVKILVFLWDKILWIVLVAVACAVLAYIITSVTWVKTYVSEIRLNTVMDSSSDKSTSTTSGEITVRQKVANYYVACLTKNDTFSKISEILEERGYNVSAETLKKSVSASVNGNSPEIINVRASGADPDLVKEICEIYGENAVEFVGDAYTDITVKIFNSAGDAKLKASNKLRNTVIGGFLGALAAAAVFVIIYLSDKTVKSGEELAEYVGVRHLGDLPDINEPFKGGYKYYNYSHSGGSEE